MISTRFYLRQDKGKGSIWIKISLGRYILQNDGKKDYQPLRFTTGIKGILASQWDKTNGRLYTRADKTLGINKHAFAVHYNGMLDRAEARINEILINAVTADKTNNEIKELYNHDEILNIELCRDAKTIKEVSIYDDRGVFLFIQKELIDKSTLAKSSIKQYVTTLKHLKDFEEYRGKLTTWKTINVDYHKEFKAYLQNKSFSPNTIQKYTKILKRFLSEADFRNIDVCQDYKGVGRFEAKGEDSQAVYITLEELDRIEALDYSNDERLNRVRDWLLIGSNTALRVSDLMRLQSYHIQGSMIRIDNKKTGVEVVIPILPPLKRVLDKYNGGFPTPLSGQKYNEYLKEVAEDAKLTDMIPIKQRKGSLSTLVEVPKHKLISSHTARRTFATNMYTRTDVKLSKAEIMMITGHSTEKSFDAYIRITKDENAQGIIDKFSKPKLKKAE